MTKAGTAGADASAGFDAAFTTDGRTLTRHADPYRLSRFQVADWDGDEFRRRLNQWFK